MGKKKRNNNGNHDKILRVLKAKTSDWKRGKSLELRTKTKLSPLVREMHAQAGVHSFNWQEYTITDGFLDHVEIQPEEVFNVVWVESRVGNDEGTGYALRTETAEEGNPYHILKESLEQRLERLYSDAKTDSFESFIASFLQSNVFRVRCIV